MKPRNNTTGEKTKKEKKTQKTDTKTTNTNKKTQEHNKQRKTEKRRGTRKKKKRAEEGRGAKNSTTGLRNGTAEEQDEPKTAERRIYRPVRAKIKLRKMNDGGKLEVAHVSTHNSSDFDTMRLRPTGQVDSRNKKFK